MKQMPVETPTMTMNSTDAMSGDICDECQGVITPQHGRPSIKDNCIKVVTSEKSVISNFAEWAKFNSHIVTAFNFIRADSYAQEFSRQSFILVFQVNSPPLDLLTFNSNLRI
jgi:hypothetical protein